MAAHRGGRKGNHLVARLVGGHLTAYALDRAGKFRSEDRLTRAGEPEEKPTDQTEASRKIQ